MQTKSLRNARAFIPTRQTLDTAVARRSKTENRSEIHREIVPRHYHGKWILANLIAERSVQSKNGKTQGLIEHFRKASAQLARARYNDSKNESFAVKN